MIESKEQAVKMLDDVLNAFEQLVVQGRRNCFIVTACGNDVAAVKEYLTKETEGMKQCKQ